jgi:NTE family protein
VKTVAIACQGGGSYCAFTAGVLQCLLRKLDPSRFSIVGLSGTSGGALCAAIAWYSLLLGDRERGARLLDSFWHAISAQSPWDLALNDTLVWLGRLGENFALPEPSPYQFPSTGQERLAQTLQAHIPFDQLDRLVKPDSPALLVGAVNILSGEFTIFEPRHADPAKRITVQTLLASAALPTLFRAVPIGKDLYWDGLFSENPPIRDFLVQPQTVADKPDEIWVIQINPQTRLDEPTSVHNIRDRRNELSGNLSLNQEIRFVQQVNDWLQRGWLSADNFKHIELRWIPLTLDLDYASKLDRNPAFVRHLIEHGEQTATAFLHGLTA